MADARIQGLTMPKWGMSMQEGTVGGWLKSEGDPVEKGEEIVEIESDKAVHLVEAPASGILARILVEAGGLGHGHLLERRVLMRVDRRRVVAVAGRERGQADGEEPPHGWRW